jgi:lactoylglutathione lyase
MHCLFEGAFLTIVNDKHLQVLLSAKEEVAFVPTTDRWTLDAGMWATRALRSAATGAAAAAAGGPSSSARPFRVLGLQQVAIGGPSKAALSRLWVDTLGLPRVGTYRSEKENVDEDVLRLGQAGPFAVELDIMEPVDPERAPKVHIPPLNHIGLWIDDLPAAVEWLAGPGGLRMAPGGIRRGASGYDVAFLHPKSTEGVLIELVQAPPEVVAAQAAASAKLPQPPLL